MWPPEYKLDGTSDWHSRPGCIQGNKKQFYKSVTFVKTVSFTSLFLHQRFSLSLICTTGNTSGATCFQNNLVRIYTWLMLSKFWVVCFYTISTALFWVYKSWINSVLHLDWNVMPLPAVQISFSHHLFVSYRLSLHNFYEFLIIEKRVWKIQHISKFYGLYMLSYNSVHWDTSFKFTLGWLRRF